MSLRKDLYGRVSFLGGMMVAMRRLGTRIAVLAFSAVTCCGAVGPVHRAPYGTDLDGRAIAALSPPGTKAVVLFFLATDCPISNRYQPEIARLDQEFRTQNVRMWIVYPNPSESAPGVRAHQREFGQSVPALLDPEQALVQMAGVRITPEAAVFRQTSDGPREMYRGRIDDRYQSLGRQRPQASHRELEEAVRAVLSRTPVRPAGGSAVGCAIVPLP